MPSQYAPQNGYYTSSSGQYPSQSGQYQSQSVQYGSHSGQYAAQSARPATRVRPYALTGGRTETSIKLPMEAVVETLPYANQFDWPAGDVRTDILRLGAGQLSIAEISAHLQRPLGMIRVVIGDLVMAGTIRIHTTLNEDATYDERRNLMERTLRGLRAL